MQQLAHAQPAAEPAPTTVRLEFAGRAGELAGIVLVNALLTIVTLGVYRFWAKTRVRRYLWSRTSLLGDAFEYTGTGGELFRGFLVVLFLVLLPLFAYNWAVNLLIGPERVGPYFAAMAPWYAAILFLIGVAMHRARRYRFSRTSWRGVRAAQQGSAALFGAKFLGCLLLDAATLGWAYPWTNTRLTAALTNDAWFGDRRFAFVGSAKPLYGRFALVWVAGALALALTMGALAAIFAMGSARPDPESDGLLVQAAPVAVVLCLVAINAVLMAWYSARELSYFIGCTRYGPVELRFDVTAGALIWLQLSNLLLLVATLGLGGPFTAMRTLRFTCDRLRFVGIIDPATIGQSAAPAPRRGEGLASAFDVDAM